jgi:transcription initiation factor TFIID subunit 11
VNGDDGKSTTGGRRSATAGATSAVNGEGDDEEEEDDDAGARDAKDGFNIDKEELERERERRFLFREAVNTAHQNRYDSYNRVKLKQADVRRLVNATLSQSVPQNVVTVVMAYTKMFAGMLIESAKEVQDEWLAAEEKRPDGEESRIFKRLRMTQPDPEDEEEQEDDEDEDDMMVEEQRKEKPAEAAAEVGGEKSDRETDESAKAEGERASRDDEDQVMGGSDIVASDKNHDTVEKPVEGAASASKSPKMKAEESTDPPIKLESKDDDQPMPDPPSIEIEKSTSEHQSQPTTQPDSNTATIANSTQETEIKRDPPPGQKDSINSSFDDEEVTSAANVQPGAGNLAKFMDEVDRGPLLPDHFREAVRRYRKARDGGTTGFTGLSLEGRENAAVRAGGKKLFR